MDQSSAGVSTASHGATTTGCASSPAARPEITVDPARKNFGAGKLGDPFPRQTFTITNSGNGTLTVRAITIAPNETDFTLAMTERLPKTLTAGQGFTVEVAAVPSAAGRRTATLQISSDATNTPAWTGDLEATTFNVTCTDLPTFLAPGDSDRIDFNYNVVDPAGVVDAAVVEVFSVKLGKVVFRNTLSSADRAHGARRLPFDGEMTGGTATPDAGEFPDSYVTVEHSPYKLRVVVSSGTRSAMAEREVKVEVVSIDLAPGPAAALRLPRHTEVLTQLNNTFPSVGTKQRLHLVSNLFDIATDGSAKAHHALTDYNAYETLWGAGPPIPLVATLSVRKSDNTTIVAPLALGLAKVLWDYKDVTKDTSALPSRTRAFVDAALDCEQSTTGPKGTNCHELRGGKRKAAPAGEVFGPSSAYDAGEIDTTAFPFDVTRAARRTWAAHSTAKRTGGAAVAGKTGAIFRPSRMAGDAYEVTAYLDLDGRLDATADPPATALKSRAVLFEIWREVHVAKIYQKDASALAYRNAPVAAYFERAFVKLVDTTNGACEEFPDYDAHFEAVLNAWPYHQLVLYGVTTRTAQKAAGPAAVTYRTRAQFEAAYVTAETTDDKVTAFMVANHGTYGVAGGDAATRAASAATMSAAVRGNAKTALEGVARAKLIADGYSDATATVADEKYGSTCDLWGGIFAGQACNRVLATITPEPKGIVVFAFEGASNLRHTAGTMTNGLAMSDTNCKLTLGGYMQYTHPDRHPGAAGTAAHELGHCMFLPHTHGIPGGDAGAHDAADDCCLMSYNYDKQPTLCGYCALRLRGWKHGPAAAAAGMVPPVTGVIVSPAAQNTRRPVLSVTARPGDFGALTVSTASAAQRLTVTNAGGAPLVLDAHTITGTEFVLSNPSTAGNTLAPNATKSWDVICTPAGAGRRTATLSLPSNDAASPFRLDLASDGVAPALTLSRSTVNFADATAGAESATVDVVITSTAAVPLVIRSVAMSGPDAHDFAIKAKPATDQSLTNTQTATITVACLGERIGTKSATLTIVTNAPASPHTVAVTADVGRPSLDLFGKTWKAFDTVAKASWAGDAGLPLDQSIWNSGNRSLRVLRVTPGGTDAGHFAVSDIQTLPYTLVPTPVAAAVALCKVAFKPTTTGPKTATLTIQWDAPQQDFVLTLTGQGLAAPTFVGAAGPVTFPATAAAASSVLQVAVQNTGGSPLTVTPYLYNATFSAPDPPGFATSGALTVAVGTTQNLSVTFTPQGPGQARAQLMLMTNDPARATVIVALSGVQA